MALIRDTSILPTLQESDPGIYDGVTTTELDNLAAEIAASLTTKHPIMRSSLPHRCFQSPQEHQKVIFRDHARPLRVCQPRTGQKSPLIAKILQDHREERRDPGLDHHL